MAKKRPAETELNAITECSICTEAFTDPRVLPCIHTFCLKCLLDYGKDKIAGDAIPCPLCRKKFIIPQNGLVGQKKNFFVEKLVNAMRLSETVRTACDICQECPDNGAQRDIVATLHCFQCQQNYCAQCAWFHSKIKVSADHVLVEIGKALQNREILTQLPSPVRNVHAGREVDMFCKECQQAVCVMCVIQSHKNHDCSDIVEASSDLRKQVQSDTDKVNEDLTQIDKTFPRHSKDQMKLNNQLDGAEENINKTADSLVANIEYDRNKLLSVVDAVRSKQAREAEVRNRAIQGHRVQLLSVKQYGDALLTSGTACDVARSAKHLHDRAYELTVLDVLHRFETHLRLPEFNLTLSNNASTENVIGHITIREDDETAGPPTVIHFTPAGSWVTAVTSLGHDVFVVRDHQSYVEVYDALTFTLRRQIPVVGLGAHTFGLSVCADTKRMYVSDFDHDSIYKVDLLGSNAVMKWSVARGPWGLSVNSAQNVLVVSQKERKLQELTSRGSLVREIQLQPDIEGPRHAIQLSANKYVVSHYGPNLHRVCLVNDQGEILRRSGGPAGSHLAQFVNPEGLAVDRHGNVLVADQVNNRLLVLDQSLSSAREMSLSVDGGLKLPRSLSYDERSHRLCVGEWKAGRAVVVDNLKDFRSFSD